MDKLSWLKQIIFGIKNCNCNKRRLDGLHNMNCASWNNGWFPKRLKARANPGQKKRSGV